MNHLLSFYLLQSYCFAITLINFGRYLVVSKLVILIYLLVKLLLLGLNLNAPTLQASTYLPSYNVLDCSLHSLLCSFLLVIEAEFDVTLV